MEDPGGKALGTGPEASGGDRFDSLLDQRFSGFDRREMERQVAEHDRRRGAPEFDTEHLRRKIRFQGEIPDNLKTVLRKALPEVLAYAAGQGLRLRDLNHEVHILARAEYEAQTGKPVPAGVSLPAASFQYNQLYRFYTVRVVLSDNPPSTAEAAAILRVIVARMLGDIFLREEVFTLAAYQEDVAAGEGEVTAALEDQIALLSELDVTVPALEEALADYGKRIGMNVKRLPDKVRKAFLQEAADEWERQKLSPERQAPIEAAYGKFLEGLLADPERGVAEAVEAADALNRQVNFLPPEEAPDYLTLKERNPRHYLRAAKLRLEHQLEILGTAVESFQALDGPEGSLSPLAEEQIEGYLTELRREKLARPYLIPGARLSEELEAQLAAFPFEVHTLLQRMPPAANPDKAFRALQRKLSQSLYQRLYTALLDLRTWFQARERGRNEAFLKGARHRSLKSAVHNFTFRRPLLRAMNARLGIVLDSIEAAPSAGREARPRSPVEAFSRAWSYFVSFRVTGEALAAQPALLPRFDARKYEQAMERAVTRAIGRGPGHFHLVHLLGCIRRRAGAEGLRALTEMLLDPPGTLRFVVNQALAPPPESGAPPLEERLEQLEQWAGAVLAARETTLRNRIVVGESD
ncbi:MAG: hypothetical protein V3T00_06230 [bacterium]